MPDFDPQAGRAMPVEPMRTDLQNDSDDDDVVSAVQGLAGLVSDVEDLSDVLTDIARFAVLAVPGAEGAGVTLVRARQDGVPKVTSWAVTHPFVREIDHLQYEICGEGPCLTAMQTQRVLTSGSLGSDARWRRFGGRVARMRVHSAMALPLVVRRAVVGAINIYTHERDAFTEHSVRLATQFAGPAAATVGNIEMLQAAHDRAINLQNAITNRAVIDQAIGIIRSRAGGTADEAFDRLRQISQTENVKLAVIAQRMVDEAVRRAHARHSASES